MLLSFRCRAIEWSQPTQDAKPQLRDGFIGIAKAIATEAAKKAGGAVATYFGLSIG